MPREPHSADGGALRLGTDSEWGPMRLVPTPPGPMRLVQTRLIPMPLVPTPPGPLMQPKRVAPLRVPMRRRPVRAPSRRRQWEQRRWSRTRVPRRCQESPRERSRRQQRRLENRDGARSWGAKAWAHTGTETGTGTEGSDSRAEATGDHRTTAPLMLSRAVRRDRKSLVRSRQRAAQRRRTTAPPA